MNSFLCELIFVTFTICLKHNWDLADRLIDFLDVSLKNNKRKLLKSHV